MNAFAVNFRNMVLPDDAKITIKQDYEEGRDQKVRIVGDSNTPFTFGKKDSVQIEMDFT